MSEISFSTQKRENDHKVNYNEIQFANGAGFSRSIDYPELTCVDREPDLFSANPGLDDNIVKGGAIWDIFRREDAPKLQEYLKRHQQEFYHINNLPVKSVLAHEALNLLTLLFDLPTYEFTLLLFCT